MGLFQGEEKPERLVICSDCGMGREGMRRRHAFYQMVAIVRGANTVCKELEHFRIILAHSRQLRRSSGILPV